MEHTRQPLSLFWLQQRSGRKTKTRRRRRSKHQDDRAQTWRRWRRRPDGAERRRGGTWMWVQMFERMETHQWAGLACILQPRARRHSPRWKCLNLRRRRRRRKEKKQKSRWNASRDTRAAASVCADVSFSLTEAIKLAVVRCSASKHISPYCSSAVFTFRPRRSSFLHRHLSPSSHL